MTDAARRLAALLDALAAEFPGFCLVDKRDSFVQRSIAVLLSVVTLGRGRSYLTSFVTTLGTKVYVPDGWDAWHPDERYAVLRHERVHLQQFRRWGWVAMALAYLSPPLPVGLAWGRMLVEKPAYEETIRTWAALRGKAHVCNAAFRAGIVAMFVGPSYGWMWPFRARVERWYDRVLDGIVG